MNLDDLKFYPIEPAAPPAILLKGEQSPAIIVGEVIKDDLAQTVCAKCEVDGSIPLADGTCDTCGATWEDTKESDEFETALELLWSCKAALEILLKRSGLVNKMGTDLESDLRYLTLSVEDFLDGYPTEVEGQ